tara:strand:- start:31023 stop:31514 length:492 start_codon:yes stop_codon:yes gene_type:complete
MKLLLSLLFLYTSVSLAKSRIGEWAAYNYEERTATRSIKGTLIKEIVEVKKRAGPNGKLVNYFKISEKLLPIGSAPMEVFTWEPESQYPPNLFLNFFVFKCTLIKSMGTIEKIKVPAGKFNTCHVKDQNSWIAAVPFNHVLFIQDEENIFRRLELIKYSWKRK